MVANEGATHCGPRAAWSHRDARRRPRGGREPWLRRRRSRTPDRPVRMRPPRSPRRSERAARSSSASGSRSLHRPGPRHAGVRGAHRAPLKAVRVSRFASVSAHLHARGREVRRPARPAMRPRARPRGAHAAGTPRSSSALLGELRAAQARTLAAADAERRRIERDIHDGAQQQIVAVRVKLSLAESALDASDPAQAARARAMVVESGRELEGALHDLRRLAHGVFPRHPRRRGAPERARGCSASGRDAGIRRAGRRRTTPRRYRERGLLLLPRSAAERGEARRPGGESHDPPVIRRAPARSRSRSATTASASTPVRTAAGRRTHEHVGSRAGVPRDPVRRVRPRDGHEHPSPDSSMTSTCAGFAGAPGRAR